LVQLIAGKKQSKKHQQEKEKKKVDVCHSAGVVSTSSSQYEVIVADIMAGVSEFKSSL